MCGFFPHTASFKGVYFWMPTRPVIFDASVSVAKMHLVFDDKSECVEDRDDVINMLLFRSPGRMPCPNYEAVEFQPRTVDNPAP